MTTRKSTCCIGSRRQARIQRYQGGGTETDLNPELAKRNEGPKRKPKRNDISEELTEKLVEAFLDGCFDYQKDWYRAGNQRTRVILKSRQIGATFYFAREALIDARWKRGATRYSCRPARPRHTSSRRISRPSRAMR